MTIPLQQPQLSDVLEVLLTAGPFLHFEERLGAGGMEALLKLGKPFGISEYGPELNLSQYSSHGLREAVAGFKAHELQAVFFWHWHSWKLSRMALVDQENVAEALGDRWVVNRDSVEIVPRKR